MPYYSPTLNTPPIQGKLMCTTWHSQPSLYEHCPENKCCWWAHDWRCQDIPTSTHCFHVSSLRGYGRPKKESFNCSCKSCFRGKKTKTQTKKTTKKTTQQQKSSPTSSQSVSLLELFCEIMSYWHRFCSLHERGRSRQLRVRKSQCLWKITIALQFLFLKYQRCSARRTIYFKEKILFSTFWGSEELVICTLQLLSPSCRSPKLMKHFQQLSSISLRALTFAAAKEKACTDPCTQSVTGCTELGQKGTCNTTVRRVIRKWCVCEMQTGSTTAQSSPALLWIDASCKANTQLW